LTIEQIIQCSADELEKMTDAELDKHFQQYYPITRPERVVKGARTPYVPPDPKMEKAKELLEQIGVDIGDSFKPFKRRK
jgi:hypothetical protein